MNQCFGRLYDSVVRECQTLCDVKKECKMVMEGRVVESKGLPCFGTYEESNYACKTACHKKEECKVEAERRANMSEEELKEAVAMTGAESVEEPITEITAEELQEPVVEETADEPVTEIEVQAEEVVVIPTPTRVSQKPKVVTTSAATGVKKPVKKDIVRELLFSPEGTTMDEMLEAIFASGAEEDTVENRKKNKTLITTWFSEFRRKGMTVEHEGERYVGNRS